MTPKQKAHQIYDQYWSAVSRGPVCKTDELPDMRPLLERAIIEAVEDEREACAKIAEDQAKFFAAEAARMSINFDAQLSEEKAARASKGIANQIRARS